MSVDYFHHAIATAIEKRLHQKAIHFLAEEEQLLADFSMHDIDAGHINYTHLTTFMTSLRRLEKSLSDIDTPLDKKQSEFISKRLDLYKTFFQITISKTIG